MIDVSIIIVSYNSVDEILANINSIQENILSLTYEILVVNNCAKDRKLAAMLKDYEHVKVIEAGANLGFGRANNLGFGQSKGQYILFVNPDVLFLSDIDQLTGLLEADSGIGLIGPSTYNGDGKILPSCGEYPGIRNLFSYNFFLNNLFPRIKWWGNFPMKYFDFTGTREVDWVSGAFMLGRKSTFKRIGGFDKDFFMYGEDIDICWRLKKAGFRVFFSDKARIIHNAGHSTRNKSGTKARLTAESSRILWNKHYSREIVKKLFMILCLGSLLRKIFWQVLNLTGISKKGNMSLYYQTLASESMKYLREQNQYGNQR
jgi:GT2 family glycosyltransferase